nr:MAG TPA_asm: hypothetical protein [Caudoviricetes sp.]
MALPLRSNIQPCYQGYVFFGNSLCRFYQPVCMRRVHPASYSSSRSATPSHFRVSHSHTEPEVPASDISKISDMPLFIT